MKHTKGPWRIVTRLDQNSWETDYFDLVTDENTPTFISKISGQSEANANLIAAAPELLDALQNLVDRDLIKDTENDHYDEVLDALNKAKGGAE